MAVLYSSAYGLVRENSRLGHQFLLGFGVLGGGKVGVLEYINIRSLEAIFMHYSGNVGEIGRGGRKSYLWPTYPPGSILIYIPKLLHTNVKCIPPRLYIPPFVPRLVPVFLLSFRGAGGPD